jgi:hypothetical protein
LIINKQLPKEQKMKNLAVILIVCFTLNSCGLILRGKKQDIEFTSNQPDIEIWLDGEKIGEIKEFKSYYDQFTENGVVKKESIENKASVSLERKTRHLLEFKKNGYITKSIRIDRTPSNFIVFLDSFFLLVPLIPDFATGAIYDLEADITNIILTKQ